MTTPRVNLFYVLRNGGHVCKNIAPANLARELVKLKRRGLQARAEFADEPGVIIGEVREYYDPECRGRLMWWCERQPSWGRAAVAHQAHNLEVAGSTPAPTISAPC